MHLPTFTVLMVEDFAADRELYRRALCQDSSCVYDLLETETVAAGLALCQTRSIDAVLLDFILPDGNGLDFLSALAVVQSNGRMPPVVMMTGQGNESTAVRAMKLGAEDYLVKRDLRPDLLQLKVRRAIESSRRRQQQQQVELSLQAANQQITTIWESMTDAYATLDRDWRLVYTNPAAIELYRQTTGLTPAEYLGKTHWEVFPATVGTIVEQEYRRAVAEGVAVHFELFYEPSETWFEVHAYPSDVGLGIYFRDINERKRDELARLAAEQERDRFFNLSIDLLVVATFEGNFVRVNPACERILGFTSTELMAQPYLDFVHPEDRAATVAVVADLSAGNVLTNFENRYRCKDGSYRWLSWSTMPDIDRQLLYANARDITERKCDEELLRQSEELKRRILESNRDCIKVVDLAGRLIYMNDYGQSLMEIDDFSTVAESQWLEFWQGSDRESARTAFSIALAGGVNRFDGYCATRKGTPKWWEVIVTPILAADGQVSQILAVSRDITDRKQAESIFQAQQATIRQQLTEIEAIYRTAPVGLCFVDTDMRFVRLNERMATIDGSSIAAHLGRTIREVLPELADTIEPLYRQVIDSGEPILDLDVSGMNAARPGVDRHWIVCYYPQKDAVERVVGVNVMVQEITDRKRAEAQLRQAEATIRQQLSEIETIYHTAPVGLGVMDANFQFIRLNERLAQINGLPVYEHIGRTIHEVVPEIADQLVPLYRQIIETGEPILNLEVSGIVPSQPGAERHWIVCYYPQTDEEDRVVGINTVVQEITARKQMEVALRQSESQLSLFVQHVPAGVAMFDRDMRYIIASDRWIDSYDLPDRDIVGRSHYDIFPDLPQRWLEIHQRCLAGAIESCEEDLFPRADGAFDWIRWEIHPWYTDTDEVGGIIIFSEVITDRKLAEKRLQESEQRLRTGVAVAGVGLATFDYATNLVELSPEAAALYGFAPETSTITRAQIHATFHPDERAELEAVIAQVLDPQGTGWFAQDHRVVWQSGEVRCLSVRKQVYFDRSGAVARPSYAILAAIDVTDRKQTQADLEERNRELDSFVFVVSHDLKAPLRAVANLSQWIEDDLDGQLSNDTQSQMNLLRSRVNRMSATIDGLLDYARVGRGEEAIEPVTVAQLLAEVIETLLPPPTFTIDLPAELPTLSTKRLPLFQIFVNLIGNGIKHHHSEAGTIQISIEERGDFYEFAIADDGSGIAPEHQERMFKIFQAVNPQNRSDSTGIGLAIVKKIIEAEGGTIWLESELGKGTTFYFTWLK
jgi:PAS domain S-box-containing protein